MELTLACLLKLKRLHKGKSLSTSQTLSESLSSSSPMLELHAHLYAIWNSPCLSAEDITPETMVDQPQMSEMDEAQAKPFALATQATILLQANLEEVPSGPSENSSPLQVVNTPENATLFSGPNPAKVLSSSLPNGLGANSGYNPPFPANISAGSQCLATNLGLPESSKYQLSIYANCGDIRGVLWAWWLHDPGGSHLSPCHLPSWNLNILLFHYAFQNPIDHSFLVITILQQSDEYCMPSGCILMDCLQFHSLVHPSMEICPITLKMYIEWSPKSQLSVIGFYGIFEHVLPAQWLHDSRGPGAPTPFPRIRPLIPQIFHRTYTLRDALNCGSLSAPFTRRLVENCTREWRPTESPSPPRSPCNSSLNIHRTDLCLCSTESYKFRHYDSGICEPCGSLFRTMGTYLPCHIQQSFFCPVLYNGQRECFEHIVDKEPRSLASLIFRVRDNRIGIACAATTSLHGSSPTTNCLVSPAVLNGFKRFEFLWIHLISVVHNPVSRWF